MIFSRTASWAASVALLFGTVSAAPVPSDLSSVDFTRHNRVNLPGGTSIMDPLEARADTQPTPKKIYNSQVVKEQDSVIAAFKTANIQWDKVKRIDEEYAESKIDRNNHHIAVFKQIKAMYGDHEHDHEHNAQALATALEIKKVAGNSGKEARKFIKDHEEKVKEQAYQARLAKEKQKEEERIEKAKLRMEKEIVRQERERAKDERKKAREEKGKKAAGKSSKR